MCSANIIKHVGLLFKMYTKNIGLKKVTMTSKVIRAKSKCATCMANKSRFLKQKHKKKWLVILILVIIKHVDILFKVQKKYKEYRFKNVAN